MPLRSPRTSTLLAAAVAGLAVLAPAPAVAQTADSPTATMTTPPPCGRTPITVVSAPVVADRQVRLVVSAPPGSVVDLYAYVQPSRTFFLLREGRTVRADGTAPFEFAFPTNTRMYAQVRGCTADPVTDSTVIDVRTALTLTAVRNGTRDYTFSGTSAPPRPDGLLVSVYRVTSDGRQVLTAQTRADRTTGAWTVRRQFTGSGRFGFVARTGQDLLNAPGSSAVRGTLVF